MSVGPINRWKHWSIVETGDPGDMAEVKRLFLDYARWFEAAFDHTFCFQGFDAELADLPGVYGPPAGAIWLAKSTQGDANTGGAVGVIAVKPLADPEVCEMKRLWVDPDCHGAGLGRFLAAQSITWARERGFRTVKLDTLKRMRAAVALYRSLGFIEIDAYVANPIDDVMFLGLTL